MLQLDLVLKSLEKVAKDEALNKKPNVMNDHVDYGIGDNLAVIKI